MTPSPLEKQTALTESCNLLYHWLMSSLAMDLATWYDRYMELKMAPMDVIWPFSVDVAFACHLVAPHLPPPYSNACSIGYYLIMTACTLTELQCKM